MIKLLIKNFLLAAITCLFLFATVAAQSNVRVVGEILDSRTGVQIPDALIMEQNGAFTAISDQNGAFQLENIPGGKYSIRVERIGYFIKVLKNIQLDVDQKLRLTVYLDENPLVADSVNIIGDSNSPAAKQQSIIRFDQAEIKKYKSLGINHLLSQMAGVQIESASALPGQMRVKIHGGSSNQVLILLDGQRLNHPQTGEVDLAEIPLEQVEAVEVTRGGNAARFGSNAFNGIVQFFTRQNIQQQHFGISGRVASFETGQLKINTANKLKYFDLMAQYDQGYSRQNFGYNYENREITRRNSWLRDHRLFSKMMRVTPNYQSSLLVSAAQLIRGLPSSQFDELVSSNPAIPFNAELREKKQALLLFHRRQLNDKNWIEGQLNYHYLNQVFDNDDPKISRKNRWKTEQLNKTIQADFGFSNKDINNLQLNFGVNYLKEILDQKNLLYPDYSIGYKTRFTWAAFSDLNYKIDSFLNIFSNVNTSAALRFERNLGSGKNIYPYLGFSFNPDFAASVALFANYSQGVRYPDFNSLFWKGDARARGNAELIPEEKEAIALGFRFNPRWRFKTKFSVNYFSEDIENLIFWHRGFDGVWEPRNETNAEKRGVDLDFVQQFWPGVLEGRIAYSHVIALNKNTDTILRDKNLIFSPRNTLNLNLSATVKKWVTQINYRYVSDRETVASNVKNTRLNAYHIWDISSAFESSLGRLKMENILSVKNLFSESYQLIAGYPMPGRSFELIIKFELNGK